MTNWIGRVGHRHLVVFFCMTSATLKILLSYNLNMAIVQMTALSNGTNSTIDLEAKVESSFDSIFPSAQTHLHWDDLMQGQILSAYYYSYTISNFLSGLIVDSNRCLGPKWILFIGVVPSGLLLLSSPVVAVASVYGFMALRVALGFLQGFVLAATYKLVNNWTPSNEKTYAISFLSIGFNLGGAISMITTGAICNNPSLGWPAAFYIPAILPLIWAAFYLFIVHDGPDKDPRISQRELTYFQNSEGNCDVEEIQMNWMALIKNGPVWANILVTLTRSFGFYVVATKLPAYLADQFHTPIESNGIFAALPYLTSIICVLLYAPLMAIAERKLTRWVPLIYQRKIYIAIATLGPGISMGLVPYFASIISINGSIRPETVIGLLIVINHACQAFSIGGDLSNIVEVAGRGLAGTVFGIASAASSLSGLIAPVMVGWILESFPLTGPERTVAWNVSFYITSAVFISGGIAYCLLASCDLQPLAKIPTIDADLDRNPIINNELKPDGSDSQWEIDNSSRDYNQSNSLANFNSDESDKEQFHTLPPSLIPAMVMKLSESNHMNRTQP